MSRWKKRLGIPPELLRVRNPMDSAPFRIPPYAPTHPTSPGNARNVRGGCYRGQA